MAVDGKSPDVESADTLAPIDPDAGTALVPSGESPVVRSGAGAGPTQPSRIDRFTVVGKLGEGGMGLVVSAYDPVLDRKVAIKLLRPAAGGSRAPDDARSRLLREAQAMARVSHPNVIPVHEAGTVDDQVFIAMEFVDGRTLGEWLTEQERDWREVLDFYVLAGRGLAAAHDADLVHRDFKPDNVLVGNDDRVCVTDFGLVSSSSSPGPKPVDLVSSAELNLDLTKTGAVMGTPLYMAPEQHRGEATDARTDQYGFCLALYRALFGQPAFAGSNYPELAENVLEGTVAEPPKNSPVPDWVRAIVMRGLSPLAEDRYPTMKALLEDLENDPDIAKRQRRRIAGLAAAVVALGGLAVFGVLRGGAADQFCENAADELAEVWNDDARAKIEGAFRATNRSYAVDTFDRVEKGLDRYATRWIAMHTETCEATRVSGKQSETLLDLRMNCLSRRRSELNALIVVLGGDADTDVLDNAIEAVGSITLLDGCADVEALLAAVPPPDDPELRRTVEALLVRLDEVKALMHAGKFEVALAAVRVIADDASALEVPALQGAVLHDRGSLEERMGQLDAAAVTLAAAIEQAARARDHKQVAAGWQELVLVLVRLNQFDRAMATIPTARASASQAGIDPDKWVPLVRIVGRIYKEQGDYENAETHMRRALELAEANPGEEHVAAVAAGDLASMYRIRGKFDLAEPLFRRSLAILEKIHGTKHPAVATTLNNLGMLLFDLGKHEDAATFYRRSLAIDEESFGADNPRLATTIVNLGLALQELGKYDEAEALFLRAIPVVIAANGEDHTTTALALNNLAVLYKTQGKYAEAEPLMKRVLAIQEKLLGRDHPDLAPPLNNLAAVYEAQGSYDKAEVLYVRALEIAESKLGVDHPLVATFVGNLSVLYDTLGRPAKAEQYAERALAIDVKNFGDAHPNTGISLNTLASLYRDNGKLKKAIPLYKRSLAVFEASIGAEHPINYYPVLGMGDTYLRMGQAGKTIPLAERAIALREGVEGDASLLARAQFILARALWIARRDRKHAVELAKRAREGYASVGDVKKKDLAEVTKWLAKRGGTD